MRPRGVVVLGHSDPCHDLYYGMISSNMLALLAAILLGLSGSVELDMN